MKKKILSFLFWDYSDVKDDVFYKAEIQANKIFAVMMANCGFLVIISFILNLLGVFGLSDKYWIDVIEMCAELFIPSLLCFIFKGRKRWLKYVLLIEFCFVVARMDSLLTFYVPLLWCVPTVLSCRYYRKGATILAASISAVLMVLSGIAWKDTQLIFDWNIFNDEDILNNLVNVENLTFANYTSKILLLEVLPRLLIFSVIAITCIEFTSSGKKLANEDLLVVEANAKMKSELTLATDIQANMLPNIFPPFPEHQEFDIYASMTPAKEVGGDFYDFFMLDEKNVAVVVADVSGKGVPAALFMVIAKTLIKNQVQSGITPAEVFSKVNQMLCEGNDVGLFVTAWMGILNIETGLMTCVNAGHNPPVICKDGKYDFIVQKPGFVLAGMEGVRYKQFDIQLSPGDKVFLYTDGVTEATDKDNSLYGNDRLVNFLNNNKELSPYDTVVNLRKDIDVFVGDAPQFDDITTLMLEYRSKQDQINMVEKIFVASDSSLDEVNNFITEELEKGECSPKTQMQLQVVIEELFINIAHYAYPSNVGKAKIAISKEDDMFVIRLTDRGIPFNPLSKKDPDISLAAEERSIGGLGIYMVKKSVDEIDYKYENGQNVLTLKKRG